MFFTVLRICLIIRTRFEYRREKEKAEQRGGAAKMHTGCKKVEIFHFNNMAEFYYGFFTRKRSHY